MSNSIIYQPQPGPQTAFMQSNADIAIIGGGAGGGKTVALNFEGMRWGLKYDEINCILFRRNANKLTIGGGLWKESFGIYSHALATPNLALKEWSFKSKHAGKPRSVTKFAGMQYEKDMYEFDGGMFDVVCFDEVQHFTEAQFWYLNGRLRSRTGLIHPYLRASCNPSAGWLATFLGWWIGDDGFAIQERSGILRYLVVDDNDNKSWFGTEKEANNFIHDTNLKDALPISVTFVPAKLSDNAILEKNDPKYRARLAALPAAERRRLLEANWRILPQGRIFNIEDFQHFSQEPAHFDYVLITVDTAQETKTCNDYTVIQTWARIETRIYLISQIRGRFDYTMQKRLIISACVLYKPNYLAIERKTNGSALLQEIPKECSVPILPIERSKDKFTRGYQAEPYVQSGYVFINPTADYYMDFVSEFSNFSPEQKSTQHDDQVDACMDAIELLLIKKIGYHPPPSLDKIIPEINHSSKPLFSSTSEQLFGKSGGVIASKYRF